MTEQSKAVRHWVWTRQRALLLALICLAVGMGGGWLIRGVQIPAAGGAPAAVKTAEAAPVQTAPAASQQPAAAPADDTLKLKQAADQQAGPLLARLKSEPNNPDLLVNLGNLYDDAKQYPAAVGYYERALKARPADANVRTDMATAYFYMGQPDRALAEFDKALSTAPTNANTLFNRGIVRWKAKADGKGAMADFEKVLSLYPNFQSKAQAEQLMAEIRQQGAVQ
jgi:tetratricopeptide (TPR) repeat protein